MNQTPRLFAELLQLSGKYYGTQVQVSVGNGAPNGDGCGAMFDWLEEQTRKQEARKTKLTAFDE